MYCTNCGAEIEEDSIFCNRCGQKIDREQKLEEEKFLETEKINEEEQIKREKEEKLIKEENFFKTENGEKQDDKDLSFLSKISIISFIILLVIGLSASLINIFFNYKNIEYTSGEALFGIIFLLSIISLWKSNKKGIFICILFILFKMLSSVYYYGNNAESYNLDNLIYDEIFYIGIFLSGILSWQGLRKIKMDE